jgi:SAM-dependent methyltransferase
VPIRLADPLPCVLCDNHTTLWAEIKGVAVDECQRCHHRQARLTIGDEHFSAIYGDDYFDGGGGGYVDYLAEGPMLVRRGERYAQILSRHTPPGRILDIGSAAGFLLEGLQHRNWQGIGIEPNDTMATHARSRGLDVRTGTLDDVADDALLSADQQGTRLFDAVSMIQVIAHIGDPAQAIERAARLMRPGGILLIETWDRASKMARLAKHNWHEYSPPSVVHWFTLQELDDTASKAGLTRIDRGLMPKWISAEHASSLLRHGKSSIPMSAKVTALLPRKLSLPYPGDDLFWALYQRQT